MRLIIWREESFDLERTLRALHPPFSIVDRFNAGLCQSWKMGRPIIVKGQKNRYYWRKEGGASYLWAQEIRNQIDGDPMVIKVSLK
ncbi:hypothetical protein [Actinomadura sp. NPDC049753]|uniref:hypothetical protein n=1 Tax=Actinomadura sp. NPDC049753 TaxID=3154739 RepID=UPI00343720A1